MKNYLITIAVLFIYTTTIAYAGDTDVIVRVKNIQFQHGKVMVSICTTQQQFENKDCKLKKATDTYKLESLLTFTGIQAEKIAVMVFQDINSNGVLDTNFIGIPTEPIGFSNNPKVKFGSPEFSEVSYSLQQNNSNVIYVILINEDN